MILTRRMQAGMHMPMHGARQQPGNLHMHVWDAVHKPGNPVPAHRHVLQVAHHSNVRCFVLVNGQRAVLG